MLHLLQCEALDPVRSLKAAYIQCPPRTAAAACAGSVTLHVEVHGYKRGQLSLAQTNWSPHHSTLPAAAFMWGDKEWVWLPLCRQLAQRLEGALASSLPPSLCRLCVASWQPRSYTMVDGIKVTFLAVTVADNLSHEFNML